MRGRQPKLTKKFLKIARKVVKNENTAICFTDEDLLYLINEYLNENEKVSKRAFEEWKSGNTPKQLPNEAHIFRELMITIRIKQKQFLFRVMLSNKTKQWRKWAWMIERKFPEWRLNQQIDITSKEEKIIGITYIVPDPEIAKK